MLICVSVSVSRAAGSYCRVCKEELCSEASTLVKPVTAMEHIFHVFTLFIAGENWKNLKRPALKKEWLQFHAERSGGSDHGAYLCKQPGAYSTQPAPTAKNTRVQKQLRDKTMTVHMGGFKNDVNVPSHPNMSLRLLKKPRSPPYFDVCCARGMRQTACRTAGGTLGGLSPPYAQQASRIIQMRPLNRHTCRVDWQLGDITDVLSIFLVPEMLAVSAGVGFL